MILFTADWDIDRYAEEIRALDATVLTKLADAQDVESVVRSLCIRGD